MARPRKNAVSSPFGGAPSANMTSWAETLGEALGRGVARGINAGLAGLGGALGSSMSAGAVSAAQPLARRRGRPPKAQAAGPVPADRRCKVEGCGREARSKGLCSAHYQAERRRLMAKG